jgi:hypothetical protein
MERPWGIKVAIAGEIIIVLILLMFFWTLNSELESAKMVSESLNTLPSNSLVQPMSQDDPMFMATSVLIYATLVIGLLHLIPAYLLWQGNNVGRYLATFLAVLDVFVAILSIPLSIIILYFLWFDSRTKDYFQTG